MPADDDLLFGKIAEKRGYLTRGQIDWCLSLQSAMKEKVPLGKILLAQGYLTDAQHGDIVALQAANMTALDPVLRKRKEATLFGKLAVREGLLTEEEANESVREQASPGEKRTLGEIMVSKGYLTSQQVKDLLSKQQKKIMSCPPCKLSFTVLTISQDGKEILCPRCKNPLAEGKPTGSTRTDAEFATQVLQAVKRERPDDSRVQPSRIIPPGAPRIKVSCVVCSQPFEDCLDSTGRLRCTGCQTTFVPK